MHPKTRYILIEAGKETGPFTHTEIEARLKSGDLSYDTVCIPKTILGVPTPLKTYFKEPPKHQKHSPPPNSSKQDDASLPDEVRYGKILGLQGKVTFEDVKQAYRKRMLEYHPDRVTGLGPKIRELAETESKRINAAFEYFQIRYKA